MLKAVYSYLMSTSRIRNSFRNGGIDSTSRCQNMMYHESTFVQNIWSMNKNIIDFKVQLLILDNLKRHFITKILLYRVGNSVSTNWKYQMAIGCY